MSSDPTPASLSPADAVVDFTIRQRSSLSYILLALGILSLGAGVYFAAKVWRSSTGVETEKKDAPAVELAGPDLDAESLTTRSEHVIGAVAGAAVGIVLLGVGAMMLVGVPRPTLAEQRTDARVNLLTLGGLLGVAFMITGLLLFIYSFSILVKWVNETTRPEEAWKPVLAILLFLVGAGLAFLGAQPARAEERNNTLVRRLVYSTNLVLSVLLLLLVLVIGNVIVALKVPNRLDTTESGFYTLSDKTKEYLAGLTTPVKAYTTFTESQQLRQFVDARRLLDAAHEVNPAMFQVQYLSPALDKEKIEALKNRFPQVDFNQDLGILLTAGADEKQHSFIPARDLVEQKGGFGAEPTVTFAGEAKLVREILFLAENKNRPVVYFTSGHGEPEVAPAMGDPQAAVVRRSANRLRAALEQVYIDVRPLEFALTNPTVPADAALVAIIDPLTPFSPEQVEAIRKYMNPQKPDGKKGKLIVATSPHPRPDGSGVAETGLEGLLGELGVQIGSEYIYSAPSRELAYTDVLAGITANAIRADNPMALEYQERRFLMPNCREVLPAGPPGPRSTVVILGSTRRISWLEADKLPDPARILNELLNDPDPNQPLAKAKRASTSSRPVAVTVSEGETGRALVFGSGEMFLDPDRRRPAAPENAELFVATVNWLRDRPDVANIQAKTYREYTPARNVSSVSVFWLPTGITILGIVAMGLGVWVFRRK